jgi:hypothetical protein
MFKKLSNENKQIVLLVSALLMLPFLLMAVNYFLPESKDAPQEKEKVQTEKTVIITETKSSAPVQTKAIPQQVAATVQEAIKQGNFSTAYMEINKVPKDSQEYKDLYKAIDAENQKRKKTPGITREPITSQSSPIRYFDESTPRDRSADAIYLYFIEISGTFWPRFCIQVVASKDPVITGLQINADGSQLEGLFAQPFVEGAADPPAGHFLRRRDVLQIGEAQFRFMQQQGESLDPAALVVGDVKDGAEAEFERVAQLLGKFGDLLLGKAGELDPKDLLNAGDRRLVDRQDMVVNAADAEHRIPCYCRAGRLRAAPGSGVCSPHPPPA